MGHFGLGVRQVDALGFYEAFAMFEAALRDEKRRLAHAIFAAHPGTKAQPTPPPYRLFPWAFPEMDALEVSRRESTWAMVDRRLHRAYERYARAEGITVEEAMYGERAAAWRWTIRLDQERLKRGE